jgi:hypothetical protein
MGSESATKARETKRAATTQELMQGIMTGGEISKRREAELAKASDYGRGIKLTDLGQTGQRITASAPTLREVGGDFKRAFFGGKAKDPAYLRSGQKASPGSKTEDFKQYTPKPREEKGIVPNIIEAGLTPMGIIAKQLMGKKADKKKLTPDQIYQSGSESYSTILGGQSKAGKKTKLGT